MKNASPGLFLAGLDTVSVSLCLRENKAKQVGTTKVTRTTQRHKKTILVAASSRAAPLREICRFRIQFAQMDACRRPVNSLC